MRIFNMMERVCKLAIAVFILMSASADASIVSSSSNFKNNLDGGQTLLNHVPKQIRLGLASKISHLSPDQTLNLLVILPSKDPAGLDSFVKELYDPKSPNYHKFLTPAQFDLMFGASSTDTSIIIDYLKSHGFTYKSQSQNGFILRVAAPVSSIEPAFRVNINNYKGSDGTLFYSPDSNPTIAPQLAGKIKALVGMDNVKKYFPHSHLKNLVGPAKILTLLKNINSKPKAVAPQSFLGHGGWMGPVDIADDFNLNALTSSSINGSGQVLGLYELDGYVNSDITTYESFYGLPNVTLNNVYTEGYDGSAGDNTSEVVLDIDLAVGVAPGLDKIIVYEAPNDGGAGWLEQWDAIAASGAASIISVSWGGNEGEFSGYDHSDFQQLASQGQTVFAASGDEGAYDNCQNGSIPPSCAGQALSVDDPASDPYITAAGISILSVNNGGTSNEYYGSETASFQSGGGISSLWTIPSYQTPVDTNVSTTMRNVPDVAFTADPNTSYGIYIGQEGGWSYWWGSSAASPIWAAFMSRVNQGRVAAGESLVGFLNPSIYQMAQSSDYTSVFHDVTTGNNSFYSAMTGYDDATGLGSFNGANMYNEFIGPAAPSGLQATGESNQVSLSWTASSGAVSYNVLRATTGAYISISTFGAVTSTNYTDNAVTDGVTYHYEIDGVNAAGIQGVFTSPASATPVGLAAPTGLHATAGNAVVTLSWTVSVGATSYNVKRSTVSGGPYTTVSTPGTVTTGNYTDSAVSNGTTYYYVVTAVNTGFESVNSAEVNATPLAPPSAPTGVVAAAGNTQVQLTWTASATAASYNVQRSTTSGSGYVTVSSSGTVVGPTYTDSGLINGTQYYYVISATNVGGTSSNSSPEATATPSVSLPLAPTGLIATPSNALVSLTWTASAGAMSYNVLRSITGDGPFTAISSPGTVTTTSYPDSTVTNGLVYYYEVSAVNGTGQGANSAQANAAPLAPPVAPTGLMATAGNAQAVLSWNASVNAASYNVKRATTSGGLYTTVSTSGAVTTTDYTDSSVTNRTTYYYVVSAVNVGGESSNSTEVSVTPVPPVASPSSLQAKILGARVGNQVVEGGVVLTWALSPTAGVTQYKIYRASGSGSYSVVTTVGATTTYTDVGMPKGVSYSYEVSAMTSTGAESLSSNSVSVNY